MGSDDRDCCHVSEALPVFVLLRLPVPLFSLRLQFAQPLCSGSCLFSPLRLSTTFGIRQRLQGHPRSAWLYIRSISRRYRLLASRLRYCLLLLLFFGRVYHLRPRPRSSRAWCFPEDSTSFNASQTVICEPLPIPCSSYAFANIPLFLCLRDQGTIPRPRPSGRRPLRSYPVCWDFTLAAWKRR